MYSQYEEERFILEALKDIPQGRLLDLGASMPTKFSNSRRLIELGWEAVLVDCSPDAIKALATEYAGVWPRVKVVQAAIVPERANDGHLVDINLTEDFVTTFDQATFDKWKGQVPYYGRMSAIPQTVDLLLYGMFREFRVWAVPREAFGFINIDLEGQSVDVFHDVFRSALRPACVCVEYDDRLTEVLFAADAYGYSLRYKNGTNVVLAR